MGVAGSGPAYVGSHRHENALLKDVTKTVHDRANP